MKKEFRTSVIVRNVYSEVLNIIQAATMSKLSLKKYNKKVGISLKPGSQINLIEKYLNEIDLILIMSVEPGFAGQKFMPEVLPKLKTIKKIISEKKLNIEIEIDGGINFQNSKTVKEAGANVIVSGSTIFKENNGNLKKNIELLRTN